MKREDVLSKKIIGAAIEVHRILGPGLLESTYEQCLIKELNLNNIKCDNQVSLPVIYKGIDVNCGYRIDILVEELVIMEIKAVEKLMPIHKAQILTYLKMSDLQLGMLINFNVPKLVSGIQRVVNGL